MQRKNVSSSSIVSIGYDESAQTLEVEFHNGSTYQYYNVPQGIYDALMGAPSTGKFFSSQIRNAYPYSRV